MVGTSDVTGHHQGLK